MQVHVITFHRYNCYIEYFGPTHSSLSPMIFQSTHDFQENWETSQILLLYNYPKLLNSQADQEETLLISVWTMNPDLLGQPPLPPNYIHNSNYSFNLL